MNKNVYLNWSFKVSNVLTEKEIDYMIEVIESDLTNEEKAEHLYSFCNHRTILSNLDFYKPAKNYSTEGTKHIKSSLKEQTTQLYCKLKKIEEYYSMFEDMGYAEKFKNPYNCTALEVEQRIKKLSILNEVFNSDLADYNKVEIMLKLFRNSDELRRSYTSFIKFGENDETLDRIRDILDNFDVILNKYKELEKQKDIINTVRYYEHYKDYYDNYNYAEFVIKCFIDLDSYDMDGFLELLGITKEMLDFYVMIIKELNPDLYNKYLEKLEANKIIRSEGTKNTIKNISSGINTGFLPDCTPFDSLEFLKIVPFKDMAFLYHLKEFMRQNTPEESSTIIKFMVDNRLYRTDLFKPLDIGSVMRVTASVNGITIAEKENQAIIDYLLLNEIPLINAAYLIARKKFINGEFNVDMINELKEAKANQKQKKKILLVPSNNR